MDYLGHKRALLPPILLAIEKTDRQMSVLDAFCGTGSVSAALRERGHRVHANDHLLLGATCASAALLVPAEPSFEGIIDEVCPASVSPFERVIAHLNALEPTVGFMTRHYSPAAADHDGIERRYFTSANASRIDAARDEIARWEKHLSEGEHALLLSALVDATVEVSNTAGTYGCYLKKWKTKSLQEFRLKARHLVAGSTEGHRVTCADATTIASEVEVDVLYADPPYTKRQYAAYYHLLETLVRNDDPPLSGSTGLRPWQTEASDWCYRRRAQGALEALVTKSSAPRLVLSYNDDGQIEHGCILEILGRHGDVSYEETSVRRYRSSSLPHKGAAVMERTYVLDRR